MNDTPRTDAIDLANDSLDRVDAYARLRGHARQLERELAAAKHNEEVFRAIALSERETLAPEAAEWFSVDTKRPLPEDQDFGWLTVLAWDGNHIFVADYWAEDKKFWPPNGKGEYWSSECDDVTHWRLLPIHGPQDDTGSHGR